MYSYGPPHMAVRRQDDQHEHTFSSYVRIRDVVQKTCLGRWTIGRSGERGSEISVLPARHDDDIYKNHKMSFQTFFVWALLLILHTWNCNPLRSNLLRLQCTCTVQSTFGRSHGSPLVWACQWPSSQPLSSPQFSHNDSLWAWRITKCHWEQGLDYREGEELSWCPSWSNSLWQGWSSGLVHCSGGNATDPIWRVLASSDGISSWTTLKSKNSNPNPNPLANQLWCIDFLTPATPLIIPHRLPAFLESLMPLKNWCSIDARWSKSIPYVSVAFFSNFKTKCYCISFF